MFLNPELAFPKLKVAQRVAQKKLGFRYVMDVIAVKPELVKGSHGVSDGSPPTKHLPTANTPRPLLQTAGRGPTRMGIAGGKTTLTIPILMSTAPQLRSEEHTTELQSRG